MFKVILASILVCTSVLANTSTPAIQSVGAISINPSHDSKVLADWYQKFGIELQLSEGVYFGAFETAAGPLYFAIHPKRADAPKKNSSGVSVVFRVNDFKGYVSKLEKNGLKAHSVQSDDTGNFAHYKDPDGNEMTVWGE